MFKKKDKEKKEIEVVTEEQANARTVKIMSGFATFAKYLAMLVVEALIMILFIVLYATLTPVTFAAFGLTTASSILEVVLICPAVLLEGGILYFVARVTMTKAWHKMESIKIVKKGKEETNE